MVKKASVLHVNHRSGVLMPSSSSTPPSSVYFFPPLLACLCLASCAAAGCQTLQPCSREIWQEAVKKAQCVVLRYTNIIHNYQLSMQDYSFDAIPVLRAAWRDVRSLSVCCVTRQRGKCQRGNIETWRSHGWNLLKHLNFLKYLLIF